jgi:hypothetical protein
LGIGYFVVEDADHELKPYGKQVIFVWSILRPFPEAKNGSKQEEVFVWVDRRLALAVGVEVGAGSYADLARIWLHLHQLKTQLIYCGVARLSSETSTVGKATVC